MSEVIAKKRDGKVLSAKDVNNVITGFMDGSVTENQMSAFLMTIQLVGMTNSEIADLTDAYIDSGKRVELEQINTVDKHSTGGVGDKASLILAPLAASLGVVVPLISNKGLSHMGGTIDKLNSIPGFNTDLDYFEFTKILRSSGVGIISPIAEVAPAEKAIYEIRDATGTAPSLALLCSSIMSKKLAGGASAIVLDVKIGNGAILPNKHDAIKLAKCMVSAGHAAGVKTTVLFTDMDQPLGNAIGNWSEVEEAWATLQGNGSPDLVHLVLTLAAQMLVASKQTDDFQLGYKLAEEALLDGRAAQRFLSMVVDQGGDSRVFIDISPNSENIFPPLSIPNHIVKRSLYSGYIHKIDTKKLGEISVNLGSGRRFAGDIIDYSAGITLRAKRHTKVNKGDLLAIAYTSRNLEDGVDLGQAVTDIQSAFIVLPDEPPQSKQLIRGFMDSNGDLYNWNETSKANGSISGSLGNKVEDGHLPLFQEKVCNGNMCNVKQLQNERDVKTTEVQSSREKAEIIRRKNEIEERKSRLEQEQKDEAERLRLEQEQKDEVERLRLEQKQKDEAEKLRLEQQQKAEAERLRLEQE
eukprot:GSMAST32.ASY1.ANO1.934.1 assembled CDS